MDTFVNHSFLPKQKKMIQSRSDKCCTKGKKLSYQPQSYKTQQGRQQLSLPKPPLLPTKSLFGDQNSHHSSHLKLQPSSPSNVHKYHQLRDMFQRNCWKHNTGVVKSGYQSNLTKPLKDQTYHRFNLKQLRRY